MSDVTKKDQLPGLFSNWPFSNSFLDDFNMPTLAKKGMDTIPSVNIKDNNGDYKLEFAAPGLSKEDFDVHVENGVLTVECEKRKSEHETDDNFTRKEFQYTSFKRSFGLPENIKEEDVIANYKDGILSVSVPKKVANNEAKRKKVNVE